MPRETFMPAARIIDVAVAIIMDSQHKILVNQRTHDKEHAGQWEFPGGKFETGETVNQALVRECKEELGITVQKHEPLVVLQHVYPNKTVRLDVQIVNLYTGKAISLENQKLAWHSLADLYHIDLLPADLPILQALENILN